MKLHTDDLAIDGRTRREQEVDNFTKIVTEIINLHSEINSEIADREAADQFLQGQISDLRRRIDKLQKQLNNSDINTEYIIDTGVTSNTYDEEAPTSVDIDDTVETTNDGLRILESKN